MKKLIAVILSLISALSISTHALASFDEELQSFELIEDSSYEVTAPAMLAPGESGEVSIAGIWASHIAVYVTAPDTVILTNNLDGGTKDLAVSFAGIALDGSDTSSIFASEPISVADISNALFGIWCGTIVYDIAVFDHGDAIEASVANEPSSDAISSVVQEEPITASIVNCEIPNERFPILKQLKTSCSKPNPQKTPLFIILKEKQHHEKIA